MKKITGVCYLVLYGISLLLPTINESYRWRDIAELHVKLFVVIIVFSALAALCGVYSLLKERYKKWEAYTMIAGSLFIFIYFFVKTRIIFDGSIFDLDNQVSALLELTSRGYNLILCMGVYLTVLGFIYDKNQTELLVENSGNIDITLSQENVMKQVNKVKSKINGDILKKNTKSTNVVNEKHKEFVARFENDLAGLQKCKELNIINETEFEVISGLIEEKQQSYNQEIKEAKDLYLSEVKLYEELVSKGIISQDVDKAVRSEVDTDGHK